MDDSYPGSDDFGETKGWNRASIVANVRLEPYKPDVTREDLLLPNEAGRLRTILICTATAIGITLLYVGAPLYMVSLFVPMGAWFFGSLAAVCVFLAVSLSWFSFHETREFRELARER
jgi:hypothetical protein